MNDATPKSMRLFFIDNQGAWPKDAKMIGDLVMWPDAGVYPGYMPVAFAEHPNFDGKIVVQAGNRGVVMTFLPGAKTGDDVKKAMSKGKNEQYRLAIDALIHRMILWRENVAEGIHHDEVDALSLAAWMAASTRSNPYARVIMAALTDFISKDNTARLLEVTKDIRANGGEPTADAFEMADAVLVTMVQSIAAKSLQVAEATSMRRPT